MFTSVLIANRGEIACRIARTARRMGMRTIAVYSAADAGALHVRECDQAVLLGAAEARQSYLSIERIIAAALETGAQSIHPGYGFLAENADFAEACARAGLVFIGPSAAAIRAMGLKDRAKALMEKAGVPIVPGYHGERQDTKFLKEKAYEIGYPVLIKPAGGGGGRGLRRVDRHAEFEAALESAIREAEAAFGSGRVLIEKCIASPRHIEIQVFADGRGNVIHLGERDCSLQRRHQKLVEEAPAPGMTPQMRARMGRTAIEAARAVGYVGAGTVEFIADSTRGLREDAFWFIEMNTRLQVEHPVTEAVTGLDLVDWQFRIAAGEALPLAQDQVAIAGHAVEARLYAEDPEHGFLPSSGKVVALRWPDGIRIESGVAVGDTVTPFYDPMVAKLVAHAATRAKALDRLAAALDATVIAGPRSNAAFLAALCRAPEVAAGGVDTGFVDRSLAALGAVPQPPDRAAVACGAARLHDRSGTRARAAAAAAHGDDDESDSPWAARDGFQFGGPRRLMLPLRVDGAPMHAVVSYGPDGARVEVDGVGADPDAMAFADGDQIFVLRRGRQTAVRLADVSAPAVSAAGGDGLVKAPMHGRLVRLLVGAGEVVAAGQALAVIEAMKMEHTLRAPFAGTVRRVAVAEGVQVVEGGEIVLIEPAESG